jgi:hypothetical protein
MLELVWSKFKNVLIVGDLNADISRSVNNDVSSRKRKRKLVVAYWCMLLTGVKVKRRCELEDDFVESLWFNVCPHNSNRPILVGALYRPPSANADADLNIENHIESVYLKSKEIILVGDFNINYLDQSAYSKHRLARFFKGLNMS